MRINLQSALLLAVLMLHPAPAMSQVFTINDFDAEFSFTGSWTKNPNKPGAFQDDHTWSHFLHPSGGGNVPGYASWNVSSPAGEYEVLVTWHELANRATDATYQVIYDNGTNSGDIVRDQTDLSQYNPDAEGFVSLGAYCNPSEVRLSNIATQTDTPSFAGYVSADAVRIVRVGDCSNVVPPPPPGSIGFGPALGADMWTSVMAQRGLFLAHGDVCDPSYPEAFVEIGNSDTGFCIEKTERTAATWVEAREACLAAGKRLPEPGEWKYVCKNAASVGFNASEEASLTDNYEWTSNAVQNTDFVTTSNGARDGIGGIRMGNGNCAQATIGWVGSVLNQEESLAFRCVR